jgi:hypothetical protein
MARTKTLQFYRGKKANLPALADGEPGFCTDTKELYIGTPAGGNVRIGEYRQVVTVPASAWTAAGKATIAVAGMTSTMSQAAFNVQLANTAGCAPAASAGLGDTDIIPGAGTITLTATGVIPTVAIDLVVTLYGG